MNIENVSMHQKLAEHGSFRAPIDDTPVNSEIDLVARIFITAQGRIYVWLNPVRMGSRTPLKETNRKKCLQSK
ncbi:hypothetical protein TNCV_3189441 [Trichonephila clavipes]|nr:hypothetical protein TNCV_3189441 [Trichonephila clavipes]